MDHVMVAGTANTVGGKLYIFIIWLDGLINYLINRQITNMVEFRSVSGLGQLVHWWDNGANQIAFGRGVVGATTAFIAINNDGHPMNQSRLQTGLPPGLYCDIISGNLQNGVCTGKSITVYADRTAAFSISNGDSDPVIAIHINAKLA
jgi:alpha-amylase